MYPAMSYFELLSRLHPLLLILLITAVMIGILLVVYYRMGGTSAPRLGDPRGRHGDPRRLDDEIRAELNRHPRSDLPRRW